MVPSNQQQWLQSQSPTPATNLGHDLEDVGHVLCHVGAKNLLKRAQQEVLKGLNLQSTVGPEIGLREKLVDTINILIRIST